MSESDTQKSGLSGAYGIDSAEAARSYYDGWAKGYDAELSENAYATPRRCAEALARFAVDPTAPLADFGCGTGLSGEALSAAGFSCLDGFDISEEMLAVAGDKKLYRSLSVLDLSQPLLAQSASLAPASYANAAAVGVLTPEIMPVTVLDEILEILPPGGCFVFSVNDHAAADGRLRARVMELTDCSAADLMLSEHGEHIPGTGLESEVTVLRKR
ncbi:MAG: methyltransferase domain-containing protein [Pseudomonadota bacterium]